MFRTGGKRTKVALVSVEPDGKAVDITSSIGRAPAARNGGETKEDRSLFASLSEERGAGDVGPVGV